jgi:hypothetical protein
VQLGVFLAHGPQLIEHGGHIPRHADLIGLGVVGLGPRFLQSSCNRVLASISPGHFASASRITLRSSVADGRRS